MGRHVDEFNNYGISNPDGVQGGLNDYTRYSFDNDVIKSIRELPTTNVIETSSFDEYPQTRSSHTNNAPQSSVDNQQSNQLQENISQSTSAASSSAASTAASSSAAAASSAAATTTTAIATVGATVGGTVAAAVVTAVMVVTAVANAFSLAVSFLSATYNSLAFEVSIENNEEQEEFRAVLYETATKAIVQEMTVSNSQIVVFEDLNENTDYTFVVYDKDEIIKFKQSYLTSTRRSLEDQINIEVKSNENGVISFDLFVPQQLANNVFTLRINDEKGKKVYAVDGSKETTSYEVAIPQDKDLVFTVSFGNRVAYQYRVEKSISPDVPQKKYTLEDLGALYEYDFNWYGAENGNVIAHLYPIDGSSDMFRAYAYFTDYGTPTEATFLEDGSVETTIRLTVNGVEYEGTTTRVIPAKINNYRYSGFAWTGGSLDEAPYAEIVFINYDDDTIQERIKVAPTLKGEETIEATHVHTIYYSASFQAPNQSYEYSDDYVFTLNNYYLEWGDVVPVSLAEGTATRAYSITYDGLDTPIESLATCEAPIIAPHGIFYKFIVHGEETAEYALENDGGLYTYTYYNEDNHYNLNIKYSEEANEFSILACNTNLQDTLDEIEIPGRIMGVDITTIGSYSFNSVNCEVINFGEQTINIESYAFNGNEYLQNVIFAGSVTSIPSYAFDGCADFRLDTFLNQPGVEDLASIGAYAFNGTASSSTVISIPQYVQTIGEYAFANNREVSLVYLPNGMNEIPEGLFSGCISLETDMMLSYFTPTTIGAEAFAYTTLSSNENTLDLSGVTAIGARAFEGMTSVQTISVPECTVDIGQGAFGKMESLYTFNTYVLGGTVTEGYDDEEIYYFGYVFANTNQWLDSNVSSFVEAKGDVDVTGNVFETDTYYLANSLTINYYGEFLNDYALCTTAAISSLGFYNDQTSSLMKIGQFALYGTSVEELEIPDTVWAIGQYAFGGNPNDYGIGVHSVTFAVGDNDDALYLGNYLFKGNTSVTHITIPDRTEYIGEDALDGCAQLAEYTAPFVGLYDANKYDPSQQSDTDFVSSKEWYTFASLFATGQADDGYMTITVPIDYSSQEEEVSGTTDVNVNMPASLSKITITGEVIPDYAFVMIFRYPDNETAHTLTSVVLPNVVTIGHYALYETQLSEQLYINSETLEYVQTYAFASSMIANFEFGAELNYIGENAFLNASLVTFTYADGTEEIEWSLYNPVEDVTESIMTTVQLVDAMNGDEGTHANRSYIADYRINRSY